MDVIMYNSSLIPTDKTANPKKKNKALVKTTNEKTSWFTSVFLKQSLRSANIFNLGVNCRPSLFGQLIIIIIIIII